MMTVIAIWAPCLGSSISFGSRGPKQRLVERKKRVRSLSPHHSDHFADAQDAHHAFQVVGKDMKTHLGAHAGERLRQEVGPTHPVLDRSKWVLNRPSSHSHHLRLAIEPLLHRLENRLVFPAADTPVIAGGALCL